MTNCLEREEDLLGQTVVYEPPDYMKSAFSMMKKNKKILKAIVSLILLKRLTN
jgi:hypothetical protein